VESIFEQQVWEALERVPKGKVTTYGRLAAAIGHPRAARAVGRELHKNSNAACNSIRKEKMLPCHRVVCKNGNLGGYLGGVRKKRTFLKYEDVPICNNRVSSSSIIDLNASSA